MVTLVTSKWYESQKSQSSQSLLEITGDEACSLTQIQQRKTKPLHYKSLRLHKPMEIQFPFEIQLRITLQGQRAQIRREHAQAAVLQLMCCPLHESP